jgi:5-methylcytosine-specific restriction endonuclease McrA
MPARRICCHPGCARITEPGKSCPLHPKHHVPRHRRYRNLCARIIANATVCGICGQPFTDPNDPPVVDHIHPRAYGGTDDPSNLQAAHRSCNGRKGAQLPSW